MLSRVGMAKAEPLRMSGGAERAGRPGLPVLPAFLSRVFALHRARSLPLLPVCSNRSVLTSAWAGGCPMDFYAILDQVIALLRQRQRVTYRALKVQFHMDDDTLEALKEELIEAQRLAVDENGRVLVWTDEAAVPPAPPAASPPTPPLAAQEALP